MSLIATLSRVLREREEVTGGNGRKVKLLCCLKRSAP